MTALDEEIERTRKQVRSHDAGGRGQERAIAEARLGGLVAARALLGESDTGCLHPRHTTDGLDDSGRTIWRCVHCGTVAAT